MGERDDVDEALTELVDAMHRNIDRLQRGLARVDQLRAARAAGKSWADIAAAEERPRILELLGQNLEELYQAGGRLRRAEARALYAEGLSMEQVARLFGVTRQRISALLKTNGRDTPPAPPAPPPSGSSPPASSSSSSSSSTSPFATGDGVRRLEA